MKRFSTTGRAKEFGTEPRRNRPTANLQTIIDMSRELTIAQVAKLANLPIPEATELRVQFLKFVQEQAPSHKWKHAMDAWLDFRIAQKT